MGMATVNYSSDPEWHGGPKYTVRILLPKQDLDYPIRENGMTIGASWDFKESEQFEWLEGNCPGKYVWEFGKELEDDRIITFIGFVRKDHVNTFSNQFEICTWNFESELQQYSIKELEQAHHFPISIIVSYLDDIDKYYKEVSEILNWCRENIHYDWIYNFDDNEIISFYFFEEKDALAFKLRWM